VKPVLQALLLADNVYKDVSSGKHIISGVFNKLFTFRAGELSAERTGGLPIVQGSHSGSPFAYISVTEVHGTAKLALRFVDLVDHSVLLQGDIEVQSSSPIDTIEMIIPLPVLPIPHPGVFALELFYGSGQELESMGSHRIMVIER
jgi:hypothetical protein